MQGTGARGWTGPAGQRQRDRSSARPRRPGTDTARRSRPRQRWRGCLRGSPAARRGLGAGHPRVGGSDPSGVICGIFSRTAVNSVRHLPASRPGVVSKARDSPVPGREPASTGGSLQSLPWLARPPFRCGAQRGRPGGVLSGFWGLQECACRLPCAGLSSHPTPSPDPDTSVSAASREQPGWGALHGRPIASTGRAHRGPREGGGGVCARGRHLGSPGGWLGRGTSWEIPSINKRFPRPQPPLVTPARCWRGCAPGGGTWRPRQHRGLAPGTRKAPSLRCSVPLSPPRRNFPHAEPPPGCHRVWGRGAAWFSRGAATLPSPVAPLGKLPAAPLQGAGAEGKGGTFLECNFSARPNKYPWLFRCWCQAKSCAGFKVLDG